MKQTLEDYCREVDEQAERFAQAEERHERADHLQAFNFGRIVQRTENSRRDACLRVGWLLAGLAIGVACGKVYPDHLYRALANKFLTRASLVGRELGRARLYSFWKSLRLRL
ncbi:MAG: hypothetical protein ABSG32_20425 [Terriglobia bacterium]|jgi:hypothetical protein